MFCNNLLIIRGIITTIAKSEKYFSTSGFGLWIAVTLVSDSGHTAGVEVKVDHVGKNFESET